MTLWTLLALFILGCAIFEFASRIVTRLEADGDFNSPLYHVLVSIAANGAALAVASILKIYKRVNNVVKVNLYTITR